MMCGAKAELEGTARTRRWYVHTVAGLSLCRAEDWGQLELSPSLASDLVSYRAILIGCKRGKRVPGTCVLHGLIVD